MCSEINVGCLSIGQSPRPDILRELAGFLPRNCRLEELGALDGVSAAELSAAAPQDGEAFYVTLLRDGTGAKITRQVLENLVQAGLIHLEQRGADLAVLLCTGEFAPMQASIPYFQGGEIIKEAVLSLYRGKKIAVVVPDPAQRKQMSQRWQDIGVCHTIYYCLPYYETSQSKALCALLQASEEDFILLDCFGFTAEMADCFQKQTGKQVLLPRQLVGMYISKYLASNLPG